MAYVLGLDIAEQEARAVLLRTTLRRNEVQRYVRVPLDASQSGRGAALHASMRELLRRLGRSPDVLIAAMPGQVASIRTLSLPSAAAKRASEILPFELEPLLPFPIEEASTTVRVTDRRSASLPARMVDHVCSARTPEAAPPAAIPVRSVAPDIPAGPS